MMQVGQTEHDRRQEPEMEIWSLFLITIMSRSIKAQLDSSFPKRHRGHDTTGSGEKNEV